MHRWGSRQLSGISTHRASTWKGSWYASGLVTQQTRVMWGACLFAPAASSILLIERSSAVACSSRQMLRMTGSTRMPWGSIARVRVKGEDDREVYHRVGQQAQVALLIADLGHSTDIKKTSAHVPFPARHTPIHIKNIGPTNRRRGSSTWTCAQERSHRPIRTCDLAVARRLALIFARRLKHSVRRWSTL